MLTLVDYGLGNTQAFVNIYRRLNIPCRVATTCEALAGADKIILPGVGAFDWGMQMLERSGLRSTLDDLVLGRKRPVLGVCVGMQMMARGSEEGSLPGLGWIAGEVRRFQPARPQQKLNLPHMGWNDVAPTQHNLFKGLQSPRFYFLHSYYFVPADPIHTLATTDFNGSFASAVCNGHIFGVQFHPEKSHQWGTELLKNFAEF